MHWTGVLVHRRIPMSARVTEDLPCVGCGYNLRGQLATGRCSECGAEVGKSLFVLAKRDLVAGCLRSAGKSYLAWLALCIACLSPLLLWTPSLAAIIIAIGAAWRAITYSILVRWGALSHLPVIGSRLRLLWICSVLELAASLAWLVTAVVLGNLLAASGARIYDMVFAAWLTFSLASALAAGWLGIAFAAMFGYDWMALEFKLQMGSVVVAVITWLILLFMAISSAKTLGVAVAWLVCTLMSSLAMIFTAVSMIHLSNAAAQADDDLEEFVR